jgi:hypothetical protein
MQKCKVPIVRLEYVILQISFYKNQFGQYRGKDLFKYISNYMD